MSAVASGWNCTPRRFAWRNTCTVPPSRARIAAPGGGVMWSPCQRTKGPRQIGSAASSLPKTPRKARPPPIGAASPPVAAASICAPKQMPMIGRPAAASRATMPRCAAIQGMSVS